MTRFVAVDWSGRAGGAAEFIWVAEVTGGRLVELRNGRCPADVIAHLAGLAVSALAMSRHEADLLGLAPDPVHALEGRVWAPPTGRERPPGPRRRADARRSPRGDR